MPGRVPSGGKIGMVHGGIAVVLPCRNEVEAIPQLVAGLHDASRDLGEPITALFVDDGSTDGTWDAIVARAGSAGHTNASHTSADHANADHISVVGLRLEAPQGKGAAQAEGLRVAQGADVVVLMDADGQHPTDRIAPLVRAVREHRTAAIGTRIGYRRSAVSSMGTAGLATLMRILGTRFDPSLSEFVALPGRDATTLARSPRLGVAPLVPLVQSVSPGYTTVPVPIGARYSGEDETRWTFSALWNKALLQILADPWRLLPRLTMLAVASFLVLALAGTAAAIHAIVQGTSPGTVAILFAIVMSAAITVGLSVALMVVTVMTLQSVAGLHDQAGVRDVVGLLASDDSRQLG